LLGSGESRSCLLGVSAISDTEVPEPGAALPRQVMLSLPLESLPGGLIADPVGCETPPGVWFKTLLWLRGGDPGAILDRHDCVDTHQDDAIARVTCRLAGFAVGWAKAGGALTQCPRAPRCWAWPVRCASLYQPPPSRRIGRSAALP
jgi:hypothetical protein